MALLSTEIERIYTEIVLGLPRSKSLVKMRPEVVAFWDTLSAEVERMRADGKSFKMISEFPNTMPVNDELRFNPQQPRKPNGQWGSTGGAGATGDDDAPSGGGSADDDDDYYSLDEDEQGLDTISDEKADAIAQSLEKKSDDFAKGGGQMDNVDDHDAGQVAVDSANETMNAMMKQPLLTTEQTQVTKGTQMTVSALSYAGEETHAVLLVKDKQGRTAGAMAIDTFAKDAKGNDVDAGGYLNLEYVGSLGTVDGTGSALAREAISMAASQGAGLALVPLDSKAVSYWKTLGFVQPQGHRNGDMFLSAASARKIAGRLGD